MPLFLDIHYRVTGATAEGIATAHRRDVECQAKHGVRFRSYYFNDATGRVYCLFEAPTAEAGAACHSEAHGGMADEITEVMEGV